MTQHKKYTGQARIIGMGSYLPQRVLSNADLEEIVETSDEWITTRTGMKERRIAAEDEFSSTMAIHAARQALERASIPAEEVELIVVATATPDYPFPSTAALVQHGLGATKAAAFDIQAACTGFIYALSIVKAYVDSGMYKNVLLIASEKLSSIVDYEDRTTCVLFGDGAAAALVSTKGPGLLIRDVCLGTDGEMPDAVWMPGGGCRTPASEKSLKERQHFLQMNGREVFKHAVRRMEQSARECLERSQMTTTDVKWIVPHQANIRIIDALAKRLEVDDSQVYKTIQKYGNTSASSVPIALEELERQEPMEEGENVLLMAFGAGLTFGASLLTHIEEDS